jgi:hypothetical protein
MQIKVTLACGCQVKVDDAADADSQPVCDQHKERRVVRVTAPAPRFKGAAHGPLADYDPNIGAR